MAFKQKQVTGQILVPIRRHRRTGGTLNFSLRRRADAAQAAARNLNLEALNRALIEAGMSCVS